MIVPGSANSLLLAQGAATGYNLTKSLRFRSSATAYLNRTPASASNQTTWTWSAWVKRGTLSTTQYLFSAGSAISTDVGLFFWTDNTFQFYSRTDSASFATTQVFRDPASWYHLVFAYDSTQSTSTNRFKVYVNGTQITALGGLTYPSQNATTAINGNGIQYINRRSDGYYFDGYMTEVNFIDGQALTPSSFGANDATTGVWQPKKYTGTYGTNGFYLPFTDTTSTTTLGYDSSGNGNNWTTNNISLTSGSTYDSMTDVPTLTSATVANYAVLNPINSSATISYANLQWNSNGNYGASSTIAPSSGKWYAEFTYSAINSTVATFGVSNLLTSSAFSGATQTWQLCYSSSGKLENAGSQTNVSTYTTGDVLAVAFDCSTGAATFYKNNTLIGTITNVAFANVPVMLGLGSGGSPSGTSTGYANFGQQPFTYTPPTGYVALNTYNLSAPTIAAGNKYMDATTYTGNGSTQSVVNAGTFKPDFVWVKNRAALTSQILVDSNRGASKVLTANTTSAEQTLSDYITGFNTNGFGVGNGASGVIADINQNSVAYVGWQWQAGQGTTSSNTNGSITSTVSVNASAGFSIVTYTGNGTVGATVGHGIGIAPQFILFKNRTNAIDWGTYHVSSGNTGFLSIDSTAGVSTATTTFLNSTTPSSSVITLGNGNVLNQSTINYVAYCWAQIAGFSQFGSYTGNGSTDGPFIYTGFRPKFILWKKTNSSTNAPWVIVDTSRSPYNLAKEYLLPNASDAEASTDLIDILSNGYKWRGTAPGGNNSGDTYIYAAFAENPMKFANAR